MAFVTSSKFTELPFRNSFSLTSPSPSLNLLIFSSSSSRKTPSFQFLKPLSSLRTNQNPKTNHQQFPKPRSPSSSSAPWLNKWSRPNPPVSDNVRKSDGRNEIAKKQTEDSERRYTDADEKGGKAIERIVLRLRNLGLGSDDEEEEEEEGGVNGSVTGEEMLEDLLRREWVRPNTILREEEGDEDDDLLLPWEREEINESLGEKPDGGLKRRTLKAPTLAELTIEDEELRRLRRNGMYLRERINVPKAGLTQAVMQKIHDNWRKYELVRLKFHEVLATDMKTAHEIVEVGIVMFWVLMVDYFLLIFVLLNFEATTKKRFDNTHF